MLREGLFCCIWLPLWLHVFHLPACLHPQSSSSILRLISRPETTNFRSDSSFVAVTVFLGHWANIFCCSMYSWYKASSLPFSRSDSPAHSCLIDRLSLSSSHFQKHLPWSTICHSCCSPWFSLKQQPGLKMKVYSRCCDRHKCHTLNKHLHKNVQVQVLIFSYISMHR